MSRQFYGKSLKNLFVSALAVLVLFVVTSCNNVIELNNGQGSLSVALPGGRSVSGARYTIELTGSNGGNHSKTAAAGQVVQFDGLYPDTYSIEVEGLDKDNAVVLYGTSDATVRAQESAVASVELMKVITTSDHLRTAINNGGIVYIGSDITVDSPLVVGPGSVDIRAAHKDVVLSSSGGDSIFEVTGGTLTLGDGKHLLTLDGKNKDGKGLYVKGGNAYLKNNGRIINHSDSNVYIEGGTFNLEGGTISGATEDGHGVYINKGTFNMRSGAIVGNTSTNDGAGVYINSDSTFNMSGGTISGNTTSSKSSKGAGVYHNGKTFTMSGGSIEGNTASQGHGVFHNSGTFKMSGSAMVHTNNEVYLNGKSITVGSFVGNHVIARITPNNYEEYSNSKKVLVKESNEQTLTSDVTNRFTVTPDGGRTPYEIHPNGYLQL